MRKAGEIKRLQKVSKKSEKKLKKGVDIFPKLLYYIKVA